MNGVIVGYFFLPETDAWLQRKAQRDADANDAKEKLLPSASWTYGEGDGKSPIINASPPARKAGKTGSSKGKHDSGSSDETETEAHYNSFVDQDDETAAILTRDDDAQAGCGCRKCAWISCVCQRMMPEQIRDKYVLGLLRVIVIVCVVLCRDVALVSCIAGLIQLGLVLSEEMLPVFAKTDTAEGGLRYVLGMRMLMHVCAVLTRPKLALF